MRAWWITYIDPIDNRDRIALIYDAKNEAEARERAKRMLNIKDEAIKKIEK